MGLWPGVSLAVRGGLWCFTPGKGVGVESSPLSRNPCVFSCADVVDASRPAEWPVAGTPAGTVVVRAADLLVRGGGMVTVEGGRSAAGELVVFCRPVVTAPAMVRRDGTVLADAWLPDLVRLGELERHLGHGVIEALVDKAVAAGRLKPRQRRRIMSYPLVIRLMIAMTLMPDASYCEALRRLAGLLADVPFEQMAQTTLTWSRLAFSQGEYDDADQWRRLSRIAGPDHADEERPDPCLVGEAWWDLVRPLFADIRLTRRRRRRYIRLRDLDQYLQAYPPGLSTVCNALRRVPIIEPADKRISAAIIGIPQ
jgi:Insertion element 4 transposase N-terminal